MALKKVTLEFRSLCSSLLGLGKDAAEPAEILEMLKENSFTEAEMQYLVGRLVTGLSSEHEAVLHRSLILLDKIKAINADALSNLQVVPKCQDDPHARPGPFEQMRFSLAQSFLNKAGSSCPIIEQVEFEKYRGEIADLLQLYLMLTGQVPAKDGLALIEEQYFADTSKFALLERGFTIICCILNDKRMDIGSKILILSTRVLFCLTHVLRMSLSVSSLENLPPANACAVRLLKSILFQCRTCPQFAVQFCIGIADNQDASCILPFILECLDCRLAFEIASKLYGNGSNAQILKNSIQSCLRDDSIPVTLIVSRLEKLFPKNSFNHEKLVEILEAFAAIHPNKRALVFGLLSKFIQARSSLPPPLHKSLKMLLLTAGERESVDKICSLIMVSGFYAGGEFFEEIGIRLEQGGPPFPILTDIFLSILSLQGRLPAIWTYYLAENSSVLIDEDSISIVFSSLHSPDVDMAERSELDESEEEEHEENNTEMSSKSDVDEAEASDVDSLASDELEEYEKKLAEMFRIKKEIKDGKRLKKESMAAFKSKIWELLLIITPKLNSPETAVAFLGHLSQLPPSLLSTGQFSKVVHGLDFKSISISDSEWLNTFEFVLSRSFPDVSVLMAIWGLLRRTLLRSATSNDVLEACRLLWDKLSAPSCRAKYFELILAFMDSKFNVVSPMRILQHLVSLVDLSVEKKIVRQSFSSAVGRLFAFKAFVKSEGIIQEVLPALRVLLAYVSESTSASASAAALRDELKPIFAILRQIDSPALSHELLDNLLQAINNQPRYANTKAEIIKLMK